MRRRLAQRVFNLIVIAHVLAYSSFFAAILLIVGGRKIYAIDLVFAFLSAVVAARLTARNRSDVWGRQHSTKVLALFAIWGLIELALGIPRFGLSAFGESRLLVLPALFFFFVLVTYRHRHDLYRLMSFAVAVVCVMPLVRAVTFYLLGGQTAFVAQFGGSSILSAQAAFRFIQAGEAALVSTAAVGLLVFAAAEADQKRRYALLTIATVLLAIIAIVQVRSAWVTAAAGILLASFLVARFARYGVLSVALAAGAVAVAGPIGSLWPVRAGAENEGTPRGGTPVESGAPASAQGDSARAGIRKSEALHASVTYSATFLKDPSADVTAAWRLTLWRQALASARQHPFVGEGLGGYWENVGPNGAPVNQMPHNGYLAVLVKLGGVGLVLLLTGLVLWTLELLRFIRSEPEPKARLLAQAVLIGVAMSATFAMFYDFTVAFWVLLGAGTVLVRSKATPAPSSATV